MNKGTYSKERYLKRYRALHGGKVFKKQSEEERKRSHRRAARKYFLSHREKYYETTRRCYSRDMEKRRKQVREAYGRWKLRKAMKELQKVMKSLQKLIGVGNG